jgi:XTP/dITP diphosphohydrolase
LGTGVRRLLIATTNRDKLTEIRQLLDGTPLDMIALLDLPPIPEPEETGTTFEENARLKALYYDGAFPSTQEAGHYTMAEDSGLVIDALNGEPGIHSSRFVRPDASYAEKFTEIYRRLDEAPGVPRTARFVCALAVVHQGVVVFETSGTIEGEVADAPQGSGGFGYDPIFYYPPYGMTLGEVSAEQKLRVAHRGVAMRTLASWLKA